jgi:hypothetical protein
MAYIELVGREMVEDLDEELDEEETAEAER